MIQIIGWLSATGLLTGCVGLSFPSWWERRWQPSPWCTPPRS